MELRRLIFCALVTVVAMPVSALTIDTVTDTVTLGAVGDSFAVDYNGQIDGIVTAGLTASAVWTLADIDDAGTDPNYSLFTFNIALDNSSSGQVANSRISIMGFDSNPVPDLSNSTVSSTSGAFDSISYGKAPGFNPLDICLKGKTGGQCAGGGGTGITPDETPDLITLVLALDALSSILEMSNFYVRYQSIDLETGENGLSGVGYGKLSAVPIPPAAWLFGSAMLGLYGVGRTKKRA